jgi:hypothetical protein
MGIGVTIGRRVAQDRGKDGVLEVGSFRTKGERGYIEGRVE